MPNFIDRLKDLKDAINTQADKLPELNDVKDILESYSDLESKKDTFSDGDVVKVFTDSKTMQYYRITKDSSGTATITALSTKPVIGVPDVLASTSEIGLFQLPSESTLDSIGMSIQKDIEVTAHENHGYFDLTQVLGKVNSIDYSEVFDRVYNSDYKYFTLYSTTSFTFSTTSTASLEYSIDGGNTWTSYTANSSITSGSANSRYEIKLRGTGNTKIDSGFTISGTAVSIEGNISALLDYTKHQSQIYPDKNAFASLFKGNTVCISDISGLNLDLINLSEGIYSYMFSGCIGITSICPTNENALLSTIKRTSKNMCSHMFENCTGLTVVDLKYLVNTNVIVAEDSCYESMFEGCTNLEFKPTDYTYTFPATVLKDKCYYHMFYNTAVKISNSNTTISYSEYSLNLPYKLDSRYYKSTSLEDMFGNTKGKFTGTPNIDSTYYLYYKSNTFAIQSLSNTSFKFTSNSAATLEYSLDNKNYSSVTKGTAITASNGVIYLRGTGNTAIGGSSSTKYFNINCTSNDIKVTGNILNLLDYTNNPTSTSNYAFSNLFYKNTCISDCSDLILPEFTSNYCYYNMFYGCTSLASAPELPATTLSMYCYQSMFCGCTSLSSAPELPATTLAQYCYNSMFYGCTSLTSAPELPATTLAQYCYNSMFYGCTNLTSAPELPATSLAYSCYNSMFQGCTSLISAPELPATTLAQYCYNSMFYGCTSLTSAPTLPATKLAWYCYYQMFYGCTSIKLSTTKTDEYNIKYRIPSSGTGTTASNALTYMFTSTGGTFKGTPSINTTYYTLNYTLLVIESNSNTSFTFTSNSAATLEYSLDNSSYSKITKGTVITASNGVIYLRGTGNTAIGGSSNTNTVFTINCSKNDIKVSGNILNLLDYTNNPTSIDPYAFAYLFYNNTCISNCSKLILPEFTSSYCYSNMFYGCTSLTSAPALSATSLAYNCYSYMFSGCTSLSLAPKLPAITLADYCYSYMFQGCTNLTIAPELPAKELTSNCYNSMFLNCNKIDIQTTMHDDYNAIYRIPSSGTGTIANGALDNMFTNTAGTMNGTPSINTEYYIKQTSIIIESISNTSFTFTSNSTANLEYSLDNSSYSKITKGTVITASNGVIYLRGTGNTAIGGSSSTKYFNINCTSNDIKVSGNILNLLDYTNNPTSMSNYAFTYLFYKNTCISDCSDLILPEFTSNYCYYNMFYGCTSLTSAPALPATKLASNCYSYMFCGCTNLSSAPELPATSLASYCYYQMFLGCTSLTSAPELPATTLASSCYSYMFSGCTSLTSAPELPATTLASSCYSYMFSGCTSLTSAPELPATTLASDCYSSMFYGCTSLISAPALSATSLAYSCYSNMFSGCTSLSSAPALSATSLAYNCYSYMFSGCTKLSSAPALPAETLADYCYSYMFQGCTNLTIAPELPAKELTSNCYSGMFYECTSLSSAPTLPAETLTDYCYSYMFYGCTSLTSAPTLPATSLASGCYYYMFYGCTSLSSAPILSATTLASYCYYQMFLGCTSLSTAPKLPATTLASYCYYQMFYGCTSIKLSTTKTDEYNIKYRIPSSGTGTTADNALDYMFSNTGGTFTGTPEINTAYYQRLLIHSIILESLSNTSFTFTSNSTANLEYSLDDSTYSSVTKGTVITASNGVIYLRGTGNTAIGGSSSTKYFNINCSKNDIKVSGNILNLLDYTNNPTSMSNYAFTYLFYNNTCISDCSDLILPEFTSNYCYWNMFRGCTSLTSAPTLPATTLASSCYYSMFLGCTSLSTAPTLPATTLASSCYYSMFYGCTSLTSAPTLPATNLTTYCYYQMFYGCTSLTSAPTLPATNLTTYCYYQMFYGCTSIKLSTTKTDEYNIEYRIPSSGTGTTASNALTYMFTKTGGTFTGTPSINTTYYTIPSFIIIESKSNSEFTFTSSINTSNTYLEYSIDKNSFIQYNAGETITATNGILYLRGITSNTINANFTISCSTNDIKVSGNILNLLNYTNNPTSMNNFAFANLFSNNSCISDCSELILPEFTSNNCYYCMFQACTSLTSIPALPATILADSCYSYMFYGCTSLTSAPALPATILADYCYSYMFYGCTSIELSTTKTNEYSIEYRIPLNNNIILAADNATEQMFGNTGGTFTGTPEINTTYYKYLNTVFTIQSASNISFTFTSNSSATLEYSFDNFTYSNVTKGTTITTSNGKLYLRGTGNTAIGGSSSTTKYFNINCSSNDIKISGNILSLLDYTNNPTNMGQYAFSNLFYKNTCISDCSDLILPEFTSNYCYQYMFYGCSKLSSAPALPATTLAQYCYYQMFYGCSKLSSAPALPATSLASFCYQSMFSNCTSLSSAPALPATSLTNYCYRYMFNGCTSLSSAPKLPATSLASYCYYQMFYGCTSLSLAPELPATSLAEYCYYQMFYGCTSLTSAPALPATTLASNCYYGMFYGCTSIKLSSTKTDEYNIEYRIPSSGTGTTASNALSYMFTNTGGTYKGNPSINTTYYTINNTLLVIESNSNTEFTFTSSINTSNTYLEYSIDKNSFIQYNAGETITATNGILYLRGITLYNTINANFTISCSTNDIKISGNILNLLDYTNNPTSMRENAFAYLFYNNTCISDCSDLILPEFTSSNCYNSMFSGCASLTSAPELPATTINSACYYYMFQECTSLTSAPALPATTLASDCYNCMFSGCASLTSAPALPATILARNCYLWMFSHCTSLTSIPALPATILADYCYYYMFYGCTSIKLSTTKTDEYTNEYRIPSSGTGTIADSALDYMFSDTGGTYTYTPSINTTYYTSNTIV